MDDGGRPFRPRSVGGVPASLAAVSALAFSLALCAWAFGEVGLMDEGLSRPVVVLVAVGVAFIAASILAAAIDGVRRCPPPSWVVMDELRMFLVDRSFLPDDTRLWPSRLSIGRPRFDRSSSCLRVRFRLRSADATLDRLKEMERGQVFRYAQDVEVGDRIDARGRRDGFELRIWYRPHDEVFGRVLEKGESRWR